MNDKLMELTEEQEKRIPEYVEKYIKIGTDTKRIHYPSAVSAVKRAYEIAGVEFPDNVIFCDGPTDANERIKAIDSSLDVFSGLYSGSMNASVIGYITFFEKELQLENLEKMHGLRDITMHCGWVNMFDTHVFISEKPLHILFDDMARLHCETGPAILYADDTAVYSWHGTRIPKEWISEGITPADALTCDNIEQRRAACEIVGWDSILDELDCEVIHRDGDPEIGTLVSVDIPDIGREKYLRVQCGTGRGFAIPVPPDMKTALEANAWTFGITMEELSQLEVRT